MILVTGATGLVGASTISILIEQGIQVRAFCRNPKRAAMHPILKEIHQDSLIEWFAGDITDINCVELAMQGIDSVIHTAAVVSFWHPRREEMMLTNIEGTANIVHACLGFGIKKLVHISSIASLGKMPYLGAEKGMEYAINEDFPWDPTATVSDYALSKFKSEMEVWRGQEEGLETIIFNPGVIIGPGFWNDSSARLFQTMAKGLKFYAPGGSGYVSSWDVARAAVWGIQSEIHGERFVLVSENWSYQNFFQAVAQSLGVPAPQICPPRWASEIAWRILDWLAGITGKEPLITKETTKSAYNTSRFDGSKYVAVSGLNYQPIDESIKKTAQIFLKELGIK